MKGRQYPRLSGTSLKFRIGLGVAMLAGGATSMFLGWGWGAVIVAALAGGYAAYKTPDAGV